jgi:hypothetical protein
VSHHNSGPRAHALPSADITDVYAFPAPERPGRLVLVLNVVPFGDPDGVFSDALIYRFRLRPVTVAGDEAALFAVGADEAEVTIDCTFSAPVQREGQAGLAQEGRCVTSTGGTVSFTVNDEAGGSADGLRVFAGSRWDPFFTDAAALVETITTGRLAFKSPGTILGDGKNVQSIVVEADCARLLGDSSTVAVVGETLVGGRLPMRWERFGRPELENAILGMKNHDPVNRDLEIRDLFNAEDAFNLSADYVGAYRARLNANLAFWDGLDGKTDWPLDATGTHPLTELLLADFLIVDVAQPYSEHTYLEIEQAALAGRPHQTCGGRSPNDDAMDTLFTLLVNAGHGPRISDGVDHPSKLAAQTFPYLAPPNPAPPALPSHHQDS